MLIKLIGGIIVISASSFLGFIFSRDCSKRPQELRALQALLQMLENEISFLSNVLTESFERIYKNSKSEISCFFNSTVTYLHQDDSLSASQAWEMAVRDNMGKTALNKEDENVLISFGRLLGSSDLDGQVKNIRLTINQLKLQEQKAEEARRKSESMYKSLGILGGLAVVIILI